jgi:demethylmenaquinone methyltransferase/2-methoxy-6-polyprenyl-1,4-benzoquinol methylase
MTDAADELARSFGYEAVDPAEKATKVRQVFDRVASRYDLMNDLMSGGVHRLWKDALVDWLAPRRGIHHLDVAGGTGDVAFRIMDRVGGDALMTVCDINHAMLEVGRDRAIDRGLVMGLSWVAGDAMALPFRDKSVDSYTIAFGIRNVTHIDRALHEAYRVLKPGGRFLCLEFSRLLVPQLRTIYDQYSMRMIPLMGRIVAKDAESYRYLVESIRRFPDQKSFAKLVADAGFGLVKVRNLSGGVAAIHSGWRL